MNSCCTVRQYAYKHSGVPLIIRVTILRLFSLFFFVSLFFFLFFAFPAFSCFCGGNASFVKIDISTTQNTHVPVYFCYPNYPAFAMLQNWYTSLPSSGDQQKGSTDHAVATLRIV